MIISKTPLRISFLGGGSDYPEFINHNEGLVLGSTINKFIFVSLKKLLILDEFNYKVSYSKLEKKKFLKDIEHKIIRFCLKQYGFVNTPLEINIVSDIPASTGLGSSSSFTVGLLNTILHFKKIKTNKSKIRIDSTNIELQNNPNVGYQDQTFASYGGFNILKFKKNEVIVKKFTKENIINEIEKNLFLIYVKPRLKSQSISKNIIKNIKNDLNVKFINEQVDIAREGISLINSNNFNLQNFCRLIDESWILKKKTSEKISNQKIDEMIDYLKKEGAKGIKLFGAGGGGFIGGFANQKVKDKIKSSIKNQMIEIEFYKYGSMIIEK